jgi:hypothetical protein
MTSKVNDESIRPGHRLLFASNLSGGNLMKDKKVYVEPQVISYTDEEILAELGGAQAQVSPS